jgi:hypothetical protein
MEDSGVYKFKGGLYVWCGKIEILIRKYDGSSAWYPILVEAGV